MGSADMSDYIWPNYSDTPRPTGRHMQLAFSKLQSLTNIADYIQVQAIQRFQKRAKNKGLTKKSRHIHRDLQWINSLAVIMFPNSNHQGKNKRLDTLSLDYAVQEKFFLNSEKSISPETS